MLSVAETQIVCVLTAVWVRGVTLGLFCYLWLWNILALGLLTLVFFFCLKGNIQCVFSTYVHLMKCLYKNMSLFLETVEPLYIPAPWDILPAQPSLRLPQTSRCVLYHLNQSTLLYTITTVIAHGVFPSAVWLGNSTCFTSHGPSLRRQIINSLRRC